MRLPANILSDLICPSNCASLDQLLRPMKLLDQVIELKDMLRFVFTRTVSSLVMTHELELIEIVQRYIIAVASAPVALHCVTLEPFRTSTTRSFVVPARPIRRLSESGPRFAPTPLPKSITLSQSSAEPKFASKSIVIPLLNWLEVMSGRSM